MSRLIDIPLGTRFGRLVTLSLEKKTHQKWLCKCDCGKLVSIPGYELRAGRYKSCGCLQREGGSERLNRWRKENPELVHELSLKKGPELAAAGLRFRQGNPGFVVELAKKGGDTLNEWRTKNPELAYKLAQENGYKNGPAAARKSLDSGRLFNTAKKDTKPELAVKAKLDELVALGAIPDYVHPYNLNNRFFVDFYVPNANTIIEVDGCYWHGCEQCGHPGRKNDNGRNAYIKACGYNLEIIKEHELK